MWADKCDARPRGCLELLSYSEAFAKEICNME